MYHKKLTISIGIPAYNESYNLKYIIQSLLFQKETNFLLKKIIIVSDGSTDKTEEAVKSFKSKKILLLKNSTRMGKSYSLNKIISSCNSDLVFLIDADVIMKANNVLNTIVKDYLKNPYDLFSVSLFPLPGETFFENSINYGESIKRYISKTWNEYNNYLSFRGAFLGVSKKLAKSIKFPNNLINDDAYLYFFAQKNKFSTGRLELKVIFYRSPKSFRDHINQSSRFKSSEEELSKYFPNIHSQYKIPKYIKIKGCLLYFIKNPILFSEYLLVFLLSCIVKKGALQPTWQPALSTKILK